jgi:hypothetical protein
MGLVAELHLRPRRVTYHPRERGDERKGKESVRASSERWATETPVFNEMEIWGYCVEDPTKLPKSSFRAAISGCGDQAADDANRTLRGFPNVKFFDKTLLPSMSPSKRSIPPRSSSP